MGRAWRGELVHLASPWDWRSGSAVICLVVSTLGLFVTGVVLGLVNGHGLAGKLMLGTINGMVGFLLFLRPGVRSWHRWTANRTNERDDI